MYHPKSDDNSPIKGPSINVNRQFIDGEPYALVITGDHGKVRVVGIPHESDKGLLQCTIDDSSLLQKMQMLLSIPQQDGERASEYYGSNIAPLINKGCSSKGR